MRRIIQGAVVILGLAVSYHFGVTATEGQSDSKRVVEADLQMLGSIAVTSSGDVYYGLYPTEGDGARWSRHGNVGANSTIVRIALVLGNYVHAVGANGNLYVSPDLGQTWSLKGNVFGSEQ